MLISEKIHAETIRIANSIWWIRTHGLTRILNGSTRINTYMVSLKFISTKIDDRKSW
jgi:hypothetical protein